jgi:hypothetical protein
MSSLLSPLLILFGLAWCISLVNRAKRWAFACWLPFTLVCAFGTFIWFFSALSLLGGGGAGAANGFATLGKQTATLYLFVAPLLAGLSYRFRPEKYPVSVVVGTIIGLIAGLVIISKVR